MSLFVVPSFVLAFWKLNKSENSEDPLSKKFMRTCFVIEIILRPSKGILRGPAWNYKKFLNEYFWFEANQCPYLMGKKSQKL